MLWDDQYLYIAAELQELGVKATLTQRVVVINGTLNNSNDKYH